MSDKAVFRLVLFISLLVLAAVIVLNEKVIPRPDDVPYFVRYQPLLHACLNGACFILLLFSYSAIRKRNITRHRRLNLTAFVLSSLFLVSYVLYHWLAGDTKFPSDNPLRYFYYFVLISHIVLAAIVLPMVLMSFYWGLKNDVPKHRRITRWSFPIWLYVTFTGVVVYVMLSPYYNFSY